MILTGAVIVSLSIPSMTLLATLKQPAYPRTATELSGMR